MKEENNLTKNESSILSLQDLAITAPDQVNEQPAECPSGTNSICLGREIWT